MVCMIDPETGASPERPHLSFKDKASKKFFDRTFPLQSEDKTQQELEDKAIGLLAQWNESLNQGTDFVCPEGFKVTWVGVKGWDELKDQLTCPQCGGSFKYAQSHCPACLTAKPHFILTIASEESLQLLDRVIDGSETMPSILPEGHSYAPIGVTDSTELSKYRSCLYCGAPVLLTFPSCEHCGMSKPYLQLRKEDTESEFDWQVTDRKTTNRQHANPSYLKDTQINVSAGYGLGVCKAGDIDIEDGASVVSASAIDVTMGLNSKAHELAAKYLTIGPNAQVHTITVYDGGTLILDASAQVDELFLGSDVTIEIRGVLKPEMFQRIRELFSAKKLGKRSHVECPMPKGMMEIYQKG